MTVVVEVDHDNVIVKAPPIIRRFLGQRVFNLAMWMSEHQGGLRVEQLTPQQARDTLSP